MKRKNWGRGLLLGLAFLFAGALCGCSKEYEEAAAVSGETGESQTQEADAGQETKPSVILETTAEALPVLNSAFEKQFTHLMQGELLDVEADIELLKSTLKMEGGK